MKHIAWVLSGSLVLGACGLASAQDSQNQAQKLPAIQKVETGKNAALLVNGKPFFPLMLWLQSPNDFALEKELNINTIVGYDGDGPEGVAAYAEKAWKANLYFVPSFSSDYPAGTVAKLAALENVLGWIQGDEPDMATRVSDAAVTPGKNAPPSKPRKVPRTSPDKVEAAYRATKAADPSHPVFMNLTSAFMKAENDYDQATRDRIYPAYARGCDFLGFDIYPVYGSAMFGNLMAPAQGTAEMRAFAKPGQPLYAWIETNRGSQWITPAKQPEVKPEHTRFETWGCIINGAAGIGYFTHKWVEPDGRKNYMQFAPKEDPAMQAELKRLNAQITSLAAAILAGPAKAKIEMKLAGDAGDLPSHFKATMLGGDLYIFAQNTDLGPNPEKLQQFEPIKPRAGKATITAEGLKAGAKIEVVDENRSIAAEEGKFSDDFAPLTEHVYKIRM